MLRQRSSASASPQNGESGPQCSYRKVTVPKITIKRRSVVLIVSAIKRALVTATVLLLLFYGLCPLLFKGSLFIRRSMLFMNWLNIPLYKNLSNPEGDFGLNCTQNFFVETQDGIRLGLWHVIPKSRLQDCNLQKPLRFDGPQAFADSRPIVYYAHGNGGARGGPHRKELFKILAYSDNLDYHVVTIDYRGYGDSTDAVPTVSGIVSDAASGYFWLLDQINGDRSRVIVWGHSLGTAVSTYFVASLQVRDQPAGLLLESPFNTIADAVDAHPLAAFFRWLPHFNWSFIEPVVRDEDTNFDTASRIGDVHCPLLILHAMDDRIVPYHLGVRLYKAALASRPKDSSPAKMISFSADHKYGHKDIYKDSELPKIVSDFVRSSIESEKVQVTVSAGLKGKSS